MSLPDNMRDPANMQRKHWELFPAFCDAEKWTGGPDPQIATITSISEGLPPQERVWLVGCYCSHHCVPSAYAVWRHWPTPQALLDDPDVEQWLQDHWQGLPVRPEMRHHRDVTKRAECLRGFARYAVGWPYGYANESEPYEVAWEHCIGEVKYFGRYMAIKFLEFLSRGPAPELALHDLRPADAWSPRRVLGWLFPRQAHIIDSKDKSPLAIQTVNNEAEGLLTHVRAYSKLTANLSWFELQVLLCEIREHWDGGYYPGASLDEELEYITKSEAVFGEGFFAEVFEHRKRLFPARCLGEIRGWDGARKQCGRMLKERGVIWSDRDFEFPIMMPRQKS